METEQKHRPLWKIAHEIENDWKKVNFAAVPYLKAMKDMDQADVKYGFDEGKHIVAYFLSNAGAWRGDVAKRIKAELKQIAGLK